MFERKFAPKVASRSKTMYNVHVRPRSNHDITTFGIELEIVNDGTVTTAQIADAIRANGVDCNAEGYGHTTRRYWKVVTDATPGMGTNGQRDGFEIVSPVLDPRQGDGCWTEIMAVCNALNTLGVTVNKSCGFHVHLHVANMNPKNVAAFVAKYVRNEHFIDLAMPKSRRLSNNQFCRSNLGYSVATDPAAYMAQVNECLNRLRTVRTFDDLRRAVHNGQDRYVKINMMAFSRQGTIEIRQAAGTTNAEKVCMWVRFMMSMLRECERSAYFRSMTHYLLTADRAWGSLWRLDDRPATMWFLRRMRKFMSLEGIDAEAAVIA